jgi:hypothetical protein
MYHRSNSSSARTHTNPKDPLRAVLPLPLHTTALTPSALKAIFAALASLDASAIPVPLPPYVPSIAELQDKLGKKRSGEQEAMGDEEREESAETSVVNEEIDRDMIYTAISTTDSTVVYYRLSKGIKKPADIPDE